MSELSNAAAKITAAAARSEVTTKFFDDVTTLGVDEYVTNTNNGLTVPSVQTQIKDLYDEDGNSLALYASQAEVARDESIAAKNEVLNLIASYEVETTEYLINTFDGSSLAVGDIVKTLGFYNTTSGTASWVKTSETGEASKSPIELVNGKLTDINGIVFDLVSDGCVNVLSFGGVNGTTSTVDSTGAFAAMAAHCLSTGDSWVANGDFYVENIDVYTSSSSDCVLYSSNNGESNAVVTVKPNPDNLSTIDVTDFNAGLPLKKGATIIPAFAGRSGEYIEVVATDLYIKRSSDSSSYRYEYHVKVVDDTGRIDPPLPYDWPETVSAAIINSELIGDKLSLTGVTTKTNVGIAGDRSSLIFVNRANTDVTCSVENNSGLTVLQLFKVETCGVNLINCTADRALVDSTNYGYNLTGCLHTLINCKQTECRRGLDGHYAYGITVIGGEYHNGIGAHFGFDYRVSQVEKIGTSSMNPNPLYFSGGDISIKDSSVTTYTGDIFNVRTDIAECIGDISIEGCDLTFDWTDLTGAPFAMIMFISPSTSAPDYGRDIVMPDNVNIRNNAIKVLGENHTGQVYKARFFSSGVSSNDFICNTTLNFDGNSYKDNGSVEYRYTINKLSYVSGDSIRINDGDKHVIGTVFFANVKADYVAPFIDFTHDQGEVSSMRGDYGWMRSASVYNTTFSVATSNTTYTEDSSWLTIGKSGDKYLRHTITNDSALKVELPENYTSVDITVSNLISSFGRFSIDGDDNNISMGDMYSGGIDIIDRVILNGTTGIDGEISVSTTGGYLYVENRKGSSGQFNIKFNM